MSHCRAPVSGDRRRGGGRVVRLVAVAPWVVGLAVGLGGADTSVSARATAPAPVGVSAFAVPLSAVYAERIPRGQVLGWPTPSRAARGSGAHAQRASGAGAVSVLEVASPDAPGALRAVWVYRPAVPDSADVPVLYFLHGLPGEAGDLAGSGIAAQLDAAFTSGALAPFVVAAPDGNSVGAVDPEWADSLDGAVDVESFVTDAAITAVEGSHRRDRAHRAIAGFSMGGYGAMNLALRHPNLYGQAVSLAGYFHTDDESGVFGDDAALLAANSPDLHLDAARDLRIMLADGADDNEPVVAGETQRFAGLLRAAGQDATVTLPAGGHTWAFVASVLPAVEAFLEQGWNPQVMAPHAR